MRNKLLSIMLIVCMSASLCACAKDTPDITASEQPQVVVEPAEEESQAAEGTEVAEELAGDTDYLGGTPWIASNYVENAKASSDVSLNDDFYLSNNRQWIIDNSIKPGFQREQYLSSFESELNSRLERIMTDTSISDSHEAELVQTYYASFLDWDERDAEGVKPLLPYLEEIEAIENVDDLHDYFCRDKIVLADFFPWSNTPSPVDASKWSVAVFSPEIFLNDVTDYDSLDNMDEYTQLTYDSYKGIVEKILVKAGYSEEEAEAIYEGAIQFEKLFSQYCYTLDDWALVDTVDAVNHQMYSVDDLEQFGGYSVLKRVLEREGYPADTQIILNEKMDFFDNYDRIVCDDNIEIMRDYLIAHSASYAAKMLDKECFYAKIDVDNALLGATGYKEETEYAISETKSILGWPASKLYCDEYVSEQDKQNIYDVIKDIIEEYKVMLREEDFLSDDTKESAIKKLENMEINCMYPDEWDDYSELELSGNFLEISMQITRFEQRKSAKDFTKPVDRKQFADTPITVNAYYNPGTNSINILPGLVGDVLYRSDMPIEEVYAKVGAVIGHEISHAFDPVGANYDEIGNYKCWWTDEDIKTFEALRQKLVDYYDSIVVWDGLSCNGEMEKGEACADMAGIGAVLRLAAKQDNFDYDLFFRSFAQLWASNVAPTYIQYMIMYDEHPLPNLRVNVTLAQFDEFYETYGIKEGDGMYIAPEDRVKIW